MKKKFSVIILFLLFVKASLGQDVDLDKKTGLVKVDGKESFLLIAQSSFLGGIGNTDYSLQNLQKEELAYLKYKTERSSNPNVQSRSYYTITFLKSGDFCNIMNFTSLSVMKSLAKAIAGAGLVVNNAIDPVAEWNYVVMNNGIVRDPNSKPVVVNVNVEQEQKPVPVLNAAAEIAIKENKIYNHSEQIGVYKSGTMGVFNTVQVYKSDGTKIAEAKRQPGGDDDWTVTKPGSVQELNILYDNTSPLEKLFK